MSTFTPTHFTLEPPDRPDQLSGAVLQSLSRPVREKEPWGVFKTLLLGGGTFGLLPLLAWPAHFAKFAAGEQRQFWHLLEWLRVRGGGDADAEKLRNSIRGSGAVATLWLVPLIMLGVLIFQFVPLLGRPSDNFSEFLRATYGYHWLQITSPSFHWRWHSFPEGPVHFYRAWTICLSIAYASLWMHIRQHASDVRRLVAQINAILTKQGVAAVRLPRLGWGFRLPWMILGGIGILFGAWWAIPAVMAGAVQQRYEQRTSLRMRGELAQRVREILLRYRPALNVPMPHVFRVICRNPLCGQIVPDGAKFCPRCGTRLQSFDVKA